MSAITITPAEAHERADVIALFHEYVASLGLDLAFQNVEAEMADPFAKYGSPSGAILIARDATGAAVGVVALKPLAARGECEIKRLYVRPAARGENLGRRLALAIIAAAGTAGYDLVRLDTLPRMGAALALYRALGFIETAPYYDNPLPGAVYLARWLD